MAHIEKYKAPAVGHMLAHYTRSKDAVMERDNIDQERTHLNYTIGFVQDEGIEYATKVRGSDATWETVAGRIESAEALAGRRLRKDAVVMADIVVTAPRNVPEGDLDKFFRSVYTCIGDMVGRENLLGGYVHMDETSPHMHVPFTPVKDGKFNYNGLVTRSFYQRFHRDLGDFLERWMGYRPEIELSEERKEEKALSHVPQGKLDDARAALEKELAPQREELARVRAAIAEETERLESVRRSRVGAEERLADLERDIGEERSRIERLGDAIARARSRIEQLGKAVAAARERIAAALAPVVPSQDAAREPESRSKRIVMPETVNPPQNRPPSVSGDLERARGATMGMGRIGRNLGGRSR